MTRLILICILSSSLSLFGQEGLVSYGIQIGDTSPNLIIKEWLKGKPIREFEKGHVYVVDFTAVGCPPCRKAIPHLSELARQYEGKVTVLGIYVRESNRRDSLDAKYLEKIKRLVNTLDDKIDFTVAVDVSQQTTADMWEVRGTPQIFIVNQEGRIAWSGTNSASLDDVLPQVLSGTLDAFKVRGEQDNLKQKLKQITGLKENGQYIAADKQLDSLIDSHPELTSVFYDYKFKVLAGDDDDRAYSLLQFMLTQELKGFVWDKFLAKTWVYPKQPNFDLALATADRALREAETDYVATNVLIEKAAIYRRRSWESNFFYRDSALKTMERAVVWSKKTNDTDFVNRVFSDYQYYKFYSLVGRNNQKANKYLKNLLSEKNSNVDWVGILDEALLFQKKPDFNLLIEIVDFQLSGKEAADSYIFVNLLGWKAKIYALSGDIKDAKKIYEKAIDLSVKLNNKKLAGLYSERLENLE